MRTVKVAQLKAKLSAHLRYVRNGEEVIVCDRDKPIARITPIREGDYSEREQRLIARGVLIPALKPHPESWPMPEGDLSEEAMLRVIREERDGR